MSDNRKNGVAGVVVLYHPSNEVLDNIKTYIYCLDSLLVIDNSSLTTPNIIKDELQKNKKITYIDNPSNVGISKAINVALSMAENKYEWLLTMDQDSYFMEDEADKYIKNSIQFARDKSDIWGFTPGLTLSKGIKRDYRAPAFSMKILCITSGNLLRVKTVLAAGGADERLFIDEVDSDLCLNLYEKGKKLYQYTSQIMVHQLGNRTDVSLGGEHIAYIYNHNHIRLYYMFRNSLYVAKKHSIYKRSRYKDVAKEFFKVVLFEKNKIIKVKYIIKGIFDYLRNRMGSIDGI